MPRNPAPYGNTIPISNGTREEIYAALMRLEDQQLTNFAIQNGIEVEISDLGTRHTLASRVTEHFIDTRPNNQYLPTGRPTEQIVNGMGGDTLRRYAQNHGFVTSPDQSDSELRQRLLQFYANPFAQTTNPVPRWALNDEGEAYNFQIETLSGEGLRNLANRMGVELDPSLTDAQIRHYLAVRERYPAHIVERLEREADNDRPYMARREIYGQWPTTTVQSEPLTQQMIENASRMAMEQVGRADQEIVSPRGSPRTHWSLENEEPRRAQRLTRDPDSIAEEMARAISADLVREFLGNRVDGGTLDQMILRIRDLLALCANEMRIRMPADVLVSTNAHNPSSVLVQVLDHDGATYGIKDWLIIAAEESVSA